MNIKHKHHVLLMLNKQNVHGIILYVNHLFHVNNTNLKHIMNVIL